MKDLFRHGNSLYESPTIDVIAITDQDIVRTSPTPDESVPGGGGEAGNWWEN